MTASEDPGAQRADAADGAREDAAPSILDMVVFGPIDAAWSMLGDPRGAAVRGRARVEQTVRQARMLGELAVRFGASELRRRTTSAADDATASTAAPAPVHRRSDQPPPNDVIADYDTLSASQIVPMLAGLDAHERGRIAAYEASGRARQTILRRCSQLDGAGA